MMLNQSNPEFLENTQLSSELMDGLKYQMDHITPRSKGGETTLENGQVVCTDENRNKSDSMPVGTL